MSKSKTKIEVLSEKPTRKLAAKKSAPKKQSAKKPAAKKTEPKVTKADMKSVFTPPSRKLVLIPQTALNTLIVTSDAFGGIGAGMEYAKVDYSQYPPKQDEPVNVLAQLHYAARGDGKEFAKLGVDEATSDNQVPLLAASEMVVREVNAEVAAPDTARIEFNRWWDKLNEKFDVQVTPE